MKTTKNYEAPVAEMIEMQMPVVMAVTTTGTGGGTSGFSGGGSLTPGS
jgi:hypothetical protein